MSRVRDPRTLSDDEVRKLDVRLAGAVDLRRDLHLFVRYVEQKGLTRTKRDNEIPKVAARRLAKLLSWAGEADAVDEEDGGSLWSDRVSHIARELGVISFDTEGGYEGYTSQERSYPDNETEIAARARSTYLRKSPLEKERALLKVLVQTTPNEFFRSSTLLQNEAFGTSGSAIGPAGRMDLPRIRRRLLDLLATLEPSTWYEFPDVVDLLGSRHPELILDPAAREPDYESARLLRKWEWTERSRGTKRPPKPSVTLEDLYRNFREIDPTKKRWSKEAERQLTSDTPHVFHRVQGRYLEFFLCEIPYLLGLVDLAFRPESDPHGLDVCPPFERLRAFRLTRRFSEIVGADPDFNTVKVRVLPTFEILVEAPSYPETTLDAIEPYARLLSEDGPIHRFRLERSKVVQTVAQDTKARPVAVLEKLTGNPLPQGVAFDLDSWTQHGGKLILYEGHGLLEILGGKQARSAALRAVGDLLEKDAIDGFALVRRPDRAFERLEAKGLVPIAVKHRERRFASCGGKLGAAARGGTAAARVPRSPAQRATKARLEPDDLVGYRSTCAPLLAALRDALQGEARTCVLVGEDLLVLSAPSLPAFRKAIRRLSGRFDVTIGGAS